MPSNTLRSVVGGSIAGVSSRVVYDAVRLDGLHQHPRGSLRVHHHHGERFHSYVYTRLSPRPRLLRSIRDQDRHHVRDGRRI